MNAPGYWTNEASGVLRPAIEAYLTGKPLTVLQIAAMRVYLRQWILCGTWAPTDGLEQLRRDVDGLISQSAIRAWLKRAIEEGIDPL